MTKYRYRKNYKLWRKQNMRKKKPIVKILLVMLMLTMCIQMFMIPSIASSVSDTTSPSKFNTALAGLLASNNQSMSTDTINIINESIKFQHGIYIEKNSQSLVVNLLNVISSKTYIVNQDNYLQCLNDSSIDQSKSETVSEQIDALISGEITYVIGNSDGWWKNTSDGKYEKQFFEQDKSFQCLYENKDLIILNANLFNENNSDKSVNYILEILKDKSLGDMINEELNKQDIQITQSSAENSIVPSSSAVDEFMTLVENSRKRMDEKVKNNAVHVKENLNSLISPNVIVIGAQKVYGGPGSIAYAQIGSLSTGDIYDVICDEFGWQYVLYNTASGYKAGYILGGNATAYPSGFSTGVSGKMSSSKTVYAGPSNSGYATICL